MKPSSRLAHLLVWLELFWGSTTTDTGPGKGPLWLAPKDAIGGTPLPNCPEDDTALGTSHQTQRPVTSSLKKSSGAVSSTRERGEHGDVYADALESTVAPSGLLGRISSAVDDTREPCAVGRHLGGVLYRPTVVFTYVVIALACFVFAASIAMMYNSVTVFNRKIQAPSISNSLWIVFYCMTGLSAATSALRYGLNSVETPEDALDVALLISALVLDGLAILFLSWSLYHQKLYRSGSSVNGGVVKPGGYEARRPRGERLKAAMMSVPAIFWAILLVYVTTLAINVVVSNDIMFYLFAGIYAAQRLPSIVLTLSVLTGSTGSDGPTAAARRWLLLGIVLSLSMALPPTVWAELLPSSCVIIIASASDILQWLGAASLVCFFIFVRSEYKRNMEECIWTTVSQIQDNFDFRRF